MHARWPRPTRERATRPRATYAPPAPPVTECVSHRECRVACPPRIVRITRELTAAVYADAQHIEDEIYGLKQSAHALADPAAGAA